MSATYRASVNRALDFILQNLDQPLPLEAVAKAAGFSPFHFHRIFRLLMEESLHDFVKRVRLERALVMMSRHDRHGHRRISLTEIAYACGFSSSADFSRSFRRRYGSAPSRLNVGEFRSQRRREWQAFVADPGHARRLDRGPVRANPDGFAVTLRSLRPRTVAYLRVENPYAGTGVIEAYQKLQRWAEPRGLVHGQWLGYMWDDPEIVPPEKCRYDVGLVVPGPSRTGEVGCIDFPAMQVAEVALRGGIDLELRALDWLYGTWLPGSRYVPTDQPCFEAWEGLPFAEGYEHFALRIHVPVRRAG